jgi:hypothetical protein
MPLARRSSDENATGAQNAAMLTVLVLVLGIVYFAVVFIVAH